MTIKKSTASEVKMQQGRKLAFQLVVGGLIGGLSSYFGLGLLGAENVTVDQLAVGGIGIIYLLIGVICGFVLIATQIRGQHSKCRGRRRDPRPKPHFERVRDLHDRLGCGVDGANHGWTGWANIGSRCHGRAACGSGAADCSIDPRLELL